MNIAGAVVLMVALVFGLGLLFSLPVMWLWNWLATDLFGFKEIGWMQSWGLLILCGLLFKSSSTKP